MSRSALTVERTEQGCAADEWFESCTRYLERSHETRESYGLYRLYRIYAKNV